MLLGWRDMKLLLVHNQYRSHQIGGEDIVFHQERAALEQALGADNVWHYSVFNDHIQKTTLLKTIWGAKEHAKAIQALIRKHHIDIVHVHNFFPLLTPLIFKAAKEAGAKVIQTLHNYRWWCLPGTFYREKQGLCQQCPKTHSFWPAVQHRCYRQSYLYSLLGAAALWWYQLKNWQAYVDEFWVLSQTQLRTLGNLNVPESKKVYKPNFVDTHHISLVSPVQKKGYLFVGRLEEGKGIVQLLDIWKTFPNSEILTIIGTGPLAAQLQQRYECPSIQFLGARQHTETLTHMASARYVFQLSLMEETFGLTIIEALQLGTPVIGYAIGTRPEYIQSGENGWLTTPEGLKHTVLHSMEGTAAQYDHMSEKARKVGRQFEPAVLIPQQLALYWAILGYTPSLTLPREAVEGTFQ
jgi:glycosyltransferase involved in cell wall biosynthesis